MALKKVKGNLERMFDKNLNDLVRGIRNNKDNEGKYIAHCIEEIKQELRQDNISVKANAVAKLIYLQMLGYDISWAGFNIIEVMSSNKLTYKRIGYLAASQSFHPDSELLMLTTNMIRKDLNSQSQYDAGLALSGLSCFVSTDLAKDLANDMMTLLSSTKPYIRKKAVLMMYKIFLRFPEALRPAFPRLKEKLEDPDSGVQSACVNVVCELARKNPRNYLSLAPVFFKLMTTSTNNWMLIKIIKLFGALTPLEPRLGKKLIEPLTNLIHSTSAMSLLYECINTVIAVLISISTGMPTHSSSIQLCVVKLRILIEDSDQNLKYLGLLAMSKILATHPKSVQAHKDLVLQCLDDKDESIRLRALDLLYGMVSKKNLMEIVKKLMVHMDKAEGTAYRDQLLSKIIHICSQNNYQHITNFEWYVSVLVEVTRMEGTQRGPLIADQMMDVTLRVKAIRAFSVQQMSLLLENTHLIAGSGVSSSNMSQVLYAAAWICGEFASELPNPQATLEAMLRGRGVSSLPGHIQAVYIHNILKLFTLVFSKAAGAGDVADDVSMSETTTADVTHVVQLAEAMMEKLPHFVSSADLEVQERASSALHLIKYVHKELTRGADGLPELAAEMTLMFAGELNPVAPKAQKKVQIPEGLDLNAWINEPLSSESSSEEDEEKVSHMFPKCGPFADSYTTKKMPELTEEELTKLREARKLEQANNLYYLKSDSGKEQMNIASDIPMESINLTVPLKIPGLASSDKYWSSTGKQQDKKKLSSKKSKKSKRGSKKQGRVSSSDEGDVTGPLAIVNTQAEMPEGAESSGDEGGGASRVEAGDPHMALDVDLDAPLREEERLPIRTHRNLPEPVDKKKESKRKNDETGKIKKKDREKKKKTKEEKRKVDKDSESVNMWLEVDPPMPVVTEEKTETAEKAEEYEKMDATKTREKKKKKSKEKEKKSGKKSKRRGGKESELLLKEVGVVSGAGGDAEAESHREGNSGLVNGVSALPVANTYLTLAEDKILKLFYDVRLLDEMTSRVVVSILVANHSPQALVKDIRINISDSSQMEMLRDGQADRFEDIKLDMMLVAGQSQEIQFVFRAVNCAAAHKLRGTLTYKAQSPDSISTQDKLDLWLRFPLTRLLSATATSPQDYASLLISQSLTAKTSLRLDNNTSFSNVLHVLCATCRLHLVEQIQQTASLYARTLDGRHVCVLIKANDEAVCLEGKSDSDSLLTNLFQEMKSVLS